MSYTATLFNAQQGHQVMSEIWPKCKAYLMAGHRLELTIKKQAKSREQEEKYHAMIGEVAKAMRSVGSKWDAEDWKRLLVDQWKQETKGESSHIVPSLDGLRVVQLGLQTRKFSIADATSFIEWLYAWGTDNGVTFND